VLEISSRLCELASEGGSVVISPARQKSILNGFSQLLLADLMSLAIRYVQSHPTDPIAISTCSQLFTSIADFLRRSDFLLKFQVDTFFLASLTNSSISDEIRFALLNGFAVIANRLDSKRAALAGPLTVPTDLTEVEISRFSDGVARLAAEVLGVSGHGAYCSNETVRDLHRCLSGVVLEVAIGCGSHFRSSLFQSALVMVSHPSFEIQAGGLAVFEFYAKKHRNEFINFTSDQQQLECVSSQDLNSP
jgi:hypothetical protein